jgi:hypothetical protein
MRFLVHLVAVVALSSSLTKMVQAASHSGIKQEAVSLIDHETLIAIKEILVAEAQQAESQVINTAWLDSEGKLHESTLVQSGMRVRGIQVKTYLDAIEKPRVEIALDEKQGTLPACFGKDDHLSRTVQLLPASISGRFDVDHHRLVSDGVNYVTGQMSEYLESSPNWHLKSARPSLDNYTRLYTGITDSVVQYVMNIHVTNGIPPNDQKPQEIPGSDPVSQFLNGRPSAFSESWIRMEVELRQVGDQVVVWRDTSDFRVPVRAVSYSDIALPKSLLLAIHSKTDEWTQMLSQYAECEPVHFQVAAFGGAKVSIDGGSDSGLKPGDRMLLIDKNKIPSRVLEPGALAELSLVQVISVRPDSAIIKYTAGAPLAEAAGKVALPF